jgi:uncharacterized membrane protein
VTATETAASTTRSQWIRLARGFVLLLMLGFITVVVVLLVLTGMRPI